MSDQATFWDERYKDAGFAFGAEPNAFLASQKHRLRVGQRALVPGDGQGRNGVWLAQQGLAVDTVDVSPLGVARAREFAATKGVGVNAEVADLREWNWPTAAYDIVASLYVHFTDEDRPHMHRAMLRALKPGGILILEAFSVEQLDMQKNHGSGGPKVATMLYSAEKLRSDFELASLEMLEELNTRLDEGHRHSGEAAVIRAIVRKSGGES